MCIRVFEFGNSACTEVDLSLDVRCFLGTFRWRKIRVKSIPYLGVSWFFTRHRTAVSGFAGAYLAAAILHGGLSNYR
ncbi:hypothetical protein BDZ45DRAFT_667994 [Acephala macrosclerotiorum]|nr:hypothetical protein BDZ45DRAFT_667994 [Acephala macrosclerotiorum]